MIWEEIMKGHQEVKSVQGLGPVDEEEFVKGVERAQNKKLLCWTVTGLMGASILQEAFDIGVITLTNIGRIAAEKGVSGKLIAVAEAAGYCQEICSYHKVMIGYALLLARGQLELVPELPAMRRPDFLWVHNGCSPIQSAGEVMGRILDLPVMGTDVPYDYDEYNAVNKEANLDYVESQLREALNVFETWVGRPFDWSRLVERIKWLADIAEIRNEVTALCQICPSVCNAFDILPASYAYRTAPLEDGVGIYKVLREELQGKIERGETDLPAGGEKLRIGWQGIFPWSHNKAIREVLARHGATLCSSFITAGSSTERGVGLDPDNPLRTAARLIAIGGPMKSIDGQMEERTKPSVEGYNLDGVIFSLLRTCRIMSLPMAVWAAKVEKELGVPTIILESDPTDPAFHDQTQVENRIDSFLERIASNNARA